MEKDLDIEDRERDHFLILKEANRIEKGVRAICIMYHEHSLDKDSKINVTVFQDSIKYRLLSIAHQYLTFYRELINCEKFLLDTQKSGHIVFNEFPFENSTLGTIQMQISSNFDNIIFHVSSVFDYMANLISYTCNTNKDKPYYWSELIKKINKKEIVLSDDIKQLLLTIHSTFIDGFYNYRSILLHRKKDNHGFMASLDPNNVTFNVKVFASEHALLYFEQIKAQFPKRNITLAYLSSWLIKESFVNLELLLDTLRLEILRESNFAENLHKHKAPGYMIVFADQNKGVLPVSEMLWSDFKKI